MCLCRHVCQKISASVDGGPSGGSRVRRPGSEDPGARTPIGARGIPNLFRHSEIFETLQFYSWFKEDIPKIKVDIPCFKNVS